MSEAPKLTAREVENFHDRIIVEGLQERFREAYKLLDRIRLAKGDPRYSHDDDHECEYRHFAFSGVRVAFDLYGEGFRYEGDPFVILHTVPFDDLLDNYEEWRARKSIEADYLESERAKAQEKERRRIQKVVKRSRYEKFLKLKGEFEPETS